jgi:lipoyl(octanoyl) transferase
MRPLRAAWLGRIAYAPAFELQRALADRRASGEIDDTLLLLEHDAVYTLGRRATDGEVLLDAADLEARGIAVERTDRGGRVTYHGPGQLVGYPIVDLGQNGDLVAYVRTLERALIATVAEYGVDAGTVHGMTGVWVGDSKIAAIGVHVSRGITTHGFALNVTADLDAFNGIIPCGIVDRGVTSIEALTGLRPSVDEVGARAATHLAELLAADLSWIGAEALISETAHV